MGNVEEMRINGKKKEDENQEKLKKNIYDRKKLMTG